MRREFRASNNKEKPTPGPRARERGALDDGKKEKRREPLPPPGRYQYGALKRARFRALNAATEEAGAARSGGKGADRAPLAGTEARGGGETGDAFPFFFSASGLVASTSWRRPIAPAHLLSKKSPRSHRGQALPPNYTANPPTIRKWISQVSAMAI